MDFKLFIMRNLSNMHVGSGDNNFGVVDNLVQRDAITSFPTINSSSLKGALREYFGNGDTTNYIFGDENQSGKYRFFAANLLFLPVRSNKKPYYMATCPSVINEFLNTLENLGIDTTDFKKLAIEVGDDKVLTKENKVRIEDWESIESAGLPEKIDLLDIENIALFGNDAFKELTNQLPVIARNNLENGQSTNLWYEEVVPRESRFFFMVGMGEEHKKHFIEKIKAGNVQVGGNASIGYGFTKITAMRGK